MKLTKRIALFLLAMMFCFSVPFSALAQTNEQTETEVQHFEDGSYIIIRTEIAGHQRLYIIKISVYFFLQRVLHIYLHRRPCRESC